MTSEEKSQRIFEIVNEERAKEGVAGLAYADWLQDYANLRAKELVEKFSHTRPNGESQSTYVEKTYGIGSGENISCGRHTPEMVMVSWMNSPGHRANILNKNYKYIAVGVYHNPDTKYADYWVQLFTLKAPNSYKTGKNTSTSKPIPTQKQESSVEKLERERRENVAWYAELQNENELKKLTHYPSSITQVVYVIDSYTTYINLNKNGEFSLTFTYVDPKYIEYQDFFSEYLKYPLSKKKELHREQSEKARLAREKKRQKKILRLNKEMIQTKKKT